MSNYQFGRRSIDCNHLGVTLVTLILSFAVIGELKAVAFVANLRLGHTQIAQNFKDEADSLLTEGTQKLGQNQFQAALEVFEKALALYQQAHDRKGEGVTLYKIGETYYSQSKFSQSIKFYEQALKIFREIDDRTQEALTLNKIGLSYSNLSQYPKALEYYQQALAIEIKEGDRSGQGTTLNNIGVIYNNLGEYPKALAYYQQALVIHQQEGNRSGQGTTLNNIGEAYRNLGEYSKALGYYQQALAIEIKEGDRSGQGTTLNNTGEAYRNLGQYSKALAYYQQALVLRRKLGDKAAEGNTLNNIGAVYNDLREYPKALKYYQQALVIEKQVGDKAGEGTTLNNIGEAYRNLGEYPKALKHYQQALVIRQQVGDKAGEGNTLNNIGEAYRNFGEYPKALEYYQQALAIRQKLGDKAGEGNTLNNIGAVYYNLGEYPKALAYCQQALAIRQKLGDKAGEGTTLNNIGEAYRNLGEYPKALEYYQQALAIRQKLGDKAGEGTTLNNIGEAYRNLGAYSKALEFHQQALVLRRKLGDKADEGNTLNNIGVVYNDLREYPKALEFYQQALVIEKQVGDKAGEGTILNNIGEAYRNLGTYSKALAYYQQALAIRQQVDDKAGEGTTLNNIGAVYYNLGEYPKALKYYQQALAIEKQVGDKAGQGNTLNNIAWLLDQQKQPELAIVFFKQSVNVREIIRKDLRVLPREQQESYTKTVAHTYRRLADLLLQQDRVLEAQQVLDLLKVQELQGYLRNVRGTGQQLIVLRPEQEILQKYNAIQESAIQLGQELTQLREIPEANRTQAQQQRIAQLVQLEKEINKLFNEFIHSSDIVQLVNQLTREVSRQNLDLTNLVSLHDDLRRLNAVILYPLILDNRLELIITTPDTAPLRRTVNVKRKELNQVIVDFRSALEHRDDNVKVPAQKLYTWLIKPLETDLKQAKATTIIYAPDGQLRYIPLTALYDGNQWLVQNYRVNNITAQSLTKFISSSPSELRVLAGAFADPKLSYSVHIGQQEFNLRGLPFAGQEVATLAETISGTTKLLDQDFSLKAIEPRMNEYSIVHFATHAAFVPGQPEDSFILFGNGDRPTLRDIESWELHNVDLVVLSACETGIGGKLGNGEEILGLGYQFQHRGARAAIASLWAVDDGGTQALMNAFYTILKRGNVTRLEALQQAQIALITANKKTDDQQQRSSIEIEAINNKLPLNVVHHLSHPYYWSPFILIGDGF